MPQIGPLEILVILIVALVVFGPAKLPQIGRQVGRGFREFRKFQAGLRDDIEDAFREDEEGDDESDEDDKPKQLGTGQPESARAETPQPDPGKRNEPPPADTTS